MPCHDAATISDVDTLFDYASDVYAIIDAHTADIAADMFAMPPIATREPLT